MSQRFARLLLFGIFCFASATQAGAGVTFDVQYRESANLFQILDCASQFWGEDTSGDGGAYRSKLVADAALTSEDEAPFQEVQRIPVPLPQIRSGKSGAAGNPARWPFHKIVDVSPGSGSPGFL
ncbi:MAG: hypothetical protein NDJ89_18820 [Oligoflexia bacterium]|nr:hypothetical protein [Oligoflexia bacterium]